MKNEPLYIAYGSNLNLPQMSFWCTTAKVVGVSEIKDYELLFRGSRSSAVATMQPLARSAVPVLVLYRHRDSTTNAVESIHASFRRVTKQEAFTNENALLKLLYLRMKELYKKREGVMYRTGDGKKSIGYRL